MFIPELQKIYNQNIELDKKISNYKNIKMASNNLKFKDLKKLKSNNELLRINFLSNIYENCKFDIIQLGNALAKIISEISGDDYILKLDNLYLVGTISTNENSLVEPCVFKKNLYLLIKKDSIIHEPFIKSFREEEFYMGDSKNVFYQNKNFVSDPFSEMIKSGDVIPFTNDDMSTYLYGERKNPKFNSMIEYYPKVNNDKLHILRYIKGLYSKLIDNFICVLIMIKCTENKKNFTNDEMDNIVNKYIDYLKLNNDIVKIWDADIFNTYNKVELNSQLIKNVR